MTARVIKMRDYLSRATGIKLSGEFKMTTVLSSRAFTYHKPDQTFICEISELGQFLPNNRSPFLKIESARTGVVIEYVLQRSVTDREGEIISWHYIPTKSSAAAHPEAASTRVIIIND